MKELTAQTLSFETVLWIPEIGEAHCYVAGLMHLPRSEEYTTHGLLAATEKHAIEIVHGIDE